MEKIKLGSGKELHLIVCGILADNEKVTLKFTPDEGDTLDGYNTLLSAASETKKLMLLSESNEQLSIYDGYTELSSIEAKTETVIGYSEDEQHTPITGRVITAVLKKPDKTERRLTALEDTVDTLVMENLGV